MKESKIRWSRGDRISLGIAVSNFNKKIKELEREESDLDLPDLQDYKKLLENILTRKNYNTILNSLKSFLQEDATEVVKVGNVEITLWEKRNNDILQRQARNFLKGEIANLEMGFGMGNPQYNEALATLQSLDNLYNGSKNSYNSKRKKLFDLGGGQTKTKRAETFKENFIKTYEQTSFKNKDKIIAKAKSFKNPQNFYNWIKDSDLIDLRQAYDVNRGLISFGDDESNFDYELELLGVI